MNEILVDVDGVLTEFEPRLRKIAEDCGFFYPEFPQFGFLDQFKDNSNHPISQEMNRPGFAFDLEPYPGAIEFINELQRYYAVKIVTAPWLSSPTWDYDRRRWLQKYFQIRARDVVFTKSKYLVGGATLIDDLPANLIPWQEFNRRPGILVNKHYNDHIDFFLRCNTFDEILEKVYQIVPR